MPASGLARQGGALCAGSAKGLVLGLVLILAACAEVAVEKITPPEEKALNAGGSQSYVTTGWREGARQPFLLLVPPQPQATVVLFPGGEGDIGLQPDGSVHTFNFLVRTRQYFVDNGLATAVVAPPSDREDFSNFRVTAAHVLDIKGVIAYLHDKLHLPVWLVGTSRGTVSAAYIASRLPGKDGPDGLVLTSLVSGTTKNQPESVYAASLGAITVNTLLVQHRHDACKVTPFSGAERILSSFSAAPVKELIPIDGGGPPTGNPCEARHHHGFIGQEAEVVKDIADWIKAHPPATR
jgi:hypothetical protein